MDIKELVINKFRENPGKFAATILKMYWDMEKQRDQFKSEHDALTDDITALKAKVSKLKRENGNLQEVIEDKNSDLLFTEDENEQLKQDLLRTEEIQEVYLKAKAFDKVLELHSQHIDTSSIYGNDLPLSANRYEYYDDGLFAYEMYTLIKNYLEDE